MTPALTWALIRDAAILLVLGLIYLQGRHQGAESVKSQDMKAVQSQLADNALRQQQYAQEARDAQVQHSHDVETISAAIAAHSAQSVFVRVPTSAGPVHGLSIPSSPQPTASRDADSGPGVSVPPIDIRPGLIAFEQRYENALDECRQALASWPH